MNNPHQILQLELNKLTLDGTLKKIPSTHFEGVLIRKLERIVGLCEKIIKESNC